MFKPLSFALVPNVRHQLESVMPRRKYFRFCMVKVSFISLTKCFHASSQLSALLSLRSHKQTFKVYKRRKIK